MAQVDEVVPSAAAMAEVEHRHGMAGLPNDLSGDQLPAAFAPFVRNAWYVVAKKEDVGRELHHIVALNEPLVMYRTEAGEAVVLDDRCAHRRFPLSKSKLVGDTIQCGYHGFTYDKSGACIWAPTLPNKPRFGVRRYPSVEVGPWVWAWFGDPDRADPSTVPFPELDKNVSWHQANGYKFLPGNYMLLIENLLDLTHLYFLHGISSLEEADKPVAAMDLGQDAVGWKKITEGAKAGFIAETVGADPEQTVTTVSTARQTGPSVHYGTEERFAAPGNEGAHFPLRLHLVHAITPETMSTVHQFSLFSMSSAPLSGMEELRNFAETVVFQQDCDALGPITEMIESDNRSGIVEYGIPGDRFGIKMRRILRRMNAEEAAARSQRDTARA